MLQCVNKSVAHDSFIYISLEGQFQDKVRVLKVLLAKQRQRVWKQNNATVVLFDHGVMVQLPPSCTVNAKETGVLRIFLFLRPLLKSKKFSVVLVYVHRSLLTLFKKRGKKL